MEVWCILFISVGISFLVENKRLAIPEPLRTFLFLMFGSIAMLTFYLVTPIDATIKIIASLVFIAGAIAVIIKVLRDRSKKPKFVAPSGSLQNDFSMQPFVLFHSPQPLSDGGYKYLRFSVKNLGAHAKNPMATAKIKGGRTLEVKPHSVGTLEKDGLFYWDIYGVQIGEKIEIEVTYTDLRDSLYPSLKHEFVAE